MVLHFCSVDCDKPNITYDRSDAVAWRRWHCRRHCPPIPVPVDALSFESLRTRCEMIFHFVHQRKQTNFIQFGANFRRYLLECFIFVVQTSFQMHLRWYRKWFSISNILFNINNNVRKYTNLFWIVLLNDWIVYENYLMENVPFCVLFLTLLVFFLDCCTFEFCWM